VTESKKKDKRQGVAKTKKLQLNKETLKDLSAPAGGKIKGGAVNQKEPPSTRPCDVY
jgi:hypothetical protein